MNQNADFTPAHAVRPSFALFGLIGEAEPKRVAGSGQRGSGTATACEMGVGQVQTLVRKGDSWEATMVQNGKTATIRLHAQDGAKPVRVQ